MNSDDPAPSAEPRVRLTRRFILILGIGAVLVAVLVGVSLGIRSTRRSAGTEPAVTASTSSPLSPRPTSAATSPGADTTTPTVNSASPASEEPTAPEVRWSPELKTGPWPTSHVQGIAVDPDKGFVYYSFTTLLVKTDLSGKLVGTVGGFTGHLGDLTFNPDDGKVYGSLEYKDAKAFYVAIFDVDKVNREDIQAMDSSIVSTVYLPEVVDDFTADLSGDGQFAGDTARTDDHRYGASGIDGIALGPKFGRTDGRNYLTVAYGIYDNTSRTDNDHQVLIQYDISGWDRIGRPLTEDDAHHRSPPTAGRKYFVYTGNTRYGVQTLTYDPWLERWFLGVYPGHKTRFPNYSLFAVDAASPPKTKALTGLPGETGATLPLAGTGLRDSSTGIRGWRAEVEYGLESLGDGLYYIARSSSSDGKHSAKLVLMSWAGDPDEPFQPVKQ